MSVFLTVGAIELDETLVAALAETHTVWAWNSRQVGDGVQKVEAAGNGLQAVPQARSEDRVRHRSAMAGACAAAIVFSGFKDDESLLRAAHGPDGLLTWMRAGAIHVPVGIHGPAAIEQLAEEHARRDQQLVAAPILLAGAPGQHAAVAVAGPPDAVAKTTPILDAMKLSVFVAGEAPREAELLALIHSATLGSALEAIAEALALVRQYGVDPAVMRDVIGEALFAGSLYAPLADAMLAGNHSASPSVRRALQIVDLAMAAGNSGHVPLPGLDACRDRLLTAVAHGDGLRAWTVVAREPSKASGL